MNIVILKGNLARDPEVRNTSGGTAVCNCAVAVNRRVKRGERWEDEATFVEFTVWGSRGEAYAKHHKKGSPTLLHGRLQLDQWEDKQTHEKRSRIKVVVEDWEFAGAGKDSGGGDYEPSSSGGSSAADDTPF